MVALASAEHLGRFRAQVIVLRMLKPPSFKAVPGMFIFLNIPCIAKSGALVSMLLILRVLTSAVVAKPLPHGIFSRLSYVAEFRRTARSDHFAVRHNLARCGCENRLHVPGLRLLHVAGSRKQVHAHAFGSVDQCGC